MVEPIVGTPRKTAEICPLLSTQSFFTSTPKNAKYFLLTMIDQLWILLCSGLVFLMQAGFMCLESGLTRAKNSINVAVKNIADFGISVALFWVSGYGVMFGISQGGWFGISEFLVSTQVESSSAIAFFLYQAMFCGTATTIISGAVAERLKFIWSLGLE